MLKKIEIKKFEKFVTSLMEKGPLYAPVRESGGVNFQEIKNPNDVTLDFYNTQLSPKSVFFPQSEDMVRYEIEKGTTTAKPAIPDVKPAVLLGVRPCDVKSFEVMDKLYEWDGVIDPYWVNRRKNTTIIGYAFESGKADTADFYNTFGITATDSSGSDVFMVKTDDYIVLKTITERGEKLLKTIPVLDDASEEDEKCYEEAIQKGRDVKTRYMSLEGADKKLYEEFETTEYWEKAAFSCLSCGVCTFVCPTCHCFDIRDETLFRKGTRKRTWDACMFTDFTLEASGHNPRANKYQRLRQRFLHKFSYYVTNFGVTSCVGCGRCTRYCPVSIDIFSVIEEAIKLPPSNQSS